jgi:hypothetical protein
VVFVNPVTVKFAVVLNVPELVTAHAPPAAAAELAQAEPVEVNKLPEVPGATLGTFAGNRASGTVPDASWVAFSPVIEAPEIAGIAPVKLAAGIVPEVVMLELPKSTAPELPVILVSSIVIVMFKLQGCSVLFYRWASQL